MKKILTLVLLGLIFLTNSCKSKENINYMKNIEEIATNASIQNSTFTIQPGDQLIILVAAKDMSVVAPFNKNYSSSDISQFSIPNNNLPTQNQTSVSGPTYIVDSDGNIDFPLIGMVNTKDKSIEELRDFLKLKVSKYVKDPTINIRNTNFKVTVLGEVAKPGQYTMPDGQPTSILGILGMAGDMTIYGERENVLLLRNIDGQLTKEYININKADFISSPYYYVKQNDIIYVSANKAKQNSSWFGPQTGVWISLASIIVTILALVVKK